MASTPAGTQLTEQYRRRMIALRAFVLRQVVQIWPAFNTDDIDESWESIEPVLMAIIAANRGTSSVLARDYYDQFRAAEGVEGESPPLIRPDEEWRERAAIALLVTGPVAAKQLISMRHPNPADVALVRVSGAMGRYVLEGGRETIKAAVVADKRAVGWARVTSGRPCAFCAMLSGRGPVYSKDGGDFQAHDHCACSLEPTFSRSQPWPGRAREFKELYNEVAAGTPNPLNAFRQALDGGD